MDRPKVTLGLAVMLSFLSQYMLSQFHKSITVALTRLCGSSCTTRGNLGLKVWTRYGLLGNDLVLLSTPSS
jgi:hypothetical protein